MDKAKQLAALLRDTAQSASNAIASNVSGPVDLLGMGLRGIGLPVPQNAFGGSQWMAEKGLTKEVPMGAPRIIGETLGMAGPALATAKAPQIARGALGVIDNAMASATMNKQAGKVFVYPQDKALATAQRNAAKPVREGGLGLRPDNTPMERAQAMGMDADIFHGQSQPNPKREYIEGLGSVVVDQPALTPISQLKAGAGNAEGGAFFGVNDPFVANGYAGGGAVYPLRVPAQSLKESGVPVGGNTENFNRMLDKNKSRYFNSELKQAKNEGYGGVVFRSVEDSAGQPLYDIPSDIYAMSNPSLVRSRFAAFDPMRRNEADLLGRADPMLLGALGLGVGGGAYLAKDK